MPESGATEPERSRQPKFSIPQLLAATCLFAVVAAAHTIIRFLPNRQELGLRATNVRFDPVDLSQTDFAPLRLRGAWQVTADDPRFEGISALVVHGRGLLALTDSGVLIRMPKPGSPGQAQIDEMGAGPGNPRYKPNRDSEALMRDPVKARWWVAFENRHEVWRYDSHFRRPVLRIRLNPRDWRRNRGVEALVPDGTGLLLFPELGRSALRLEGKTLRAFPLRGVRGRISDAVRLPDGEVLLLEGRFGLTGFSTALLMLGKEHDYYTVTKRFPVRFGRLDNVEAIAAESLGPGRVRLWMMTDDNGQRPLRTLLVAADFKLEAAAGT